MASKDTSLYGKSSTGHQGKIYICENYIIAVLLRNNRFVSSDSRSGEVSVDNTFSEVPSYTRSRI